MGGTRLSAAEEAALALLAKAGDRAARGRLIESVMDLIHWFALRFERANIGPDDLAGEGVVGGLEAIATFDPAKGRWPTWAAIWIKAAMRRARTRAALVAIPPCRRRQARRYRDVLAGLRGSEGFEPEPEAIAEAIGASVESLDAVIMAAEGAASRPFGGSDAMLFVPAPEEPTAQEAQNKDEAEQHDAEMRQWIRKAILRGGGNELEASLVIGHVLDDTSVTQLTLRTRGYRLNHKAVREAVERGIARLRAAYVDKPPSSEWAAA